MRHLWEVEKPYYMTEGCYHETGCHAVYKNWNTFINDWGTSDLDMNRIHRFDAYDEAERDVRDGEFVIFIYRVFQRKGYTASQEVFVSKDREQEVIDYLRPYFEQEQEIWAPFTDKQEPSK